MNTLRAIRRLLSPLTVFGALLVVFGAGSPALAQEVIGYSEILGTTNSTHIDTWSETAMDANTAYYYDAYVEGYLFQNNSLVIDGYASGNPYAGGGFTEPLTVGDTYEIDSYHYLIQYFSYQDGSGNYYYSNPYYYLADGSGDGYDPNGYGYTDGGGPLYYENYQYLFLGATYVVLPTGVPNITSYNPTDGSVETSGTLTLGGTNLEDLFTQSTTPAITGSGMTLTVQSVTPTQVTLNYTIAENASPGAHSITLATRFGTSNPVSFNVGDPTPVVKNVSPSTWDANNSYSVTITGTGFGTKPTVSLSGTGVTFTPGTVGDTQITGTVVVAASAPDETVTVTVQNNGYYGNGFLGTTPGQSPDGTNNTPQVVAYPAPAPKIMFGGSDVTGKSQNAVVGQQIALTTSVSLPSGLAVTSSSWTIPGTNIGGYTPTPPAPPTGNITPTVVTNPSATFYWVYAGQSMAVPYSYCMSNQKCSTPVQTTFSVTGPSGGKMTFTTSKVTISTLTDCTTGAKVKWLAFGIISGTTCAPTGTPGITFTGSVKQQPAGGGNLSWVQLVTNNQITVNGTGYNCGTGLDNFYPLPPPLPPTDSPSSGLAGTDTEDTRTFSASMYLLWTSSVASSIPVPIGYVSWGYFGDAVQNMTKHTWSLKSSNKTTPVFYSSLPSQPFDGYPTWNTVAKNGQACTQ